MSFVKSAFESLTGKSSEEKAIAASETSAGAQREALGYLRETEALPQELREAALSQLGGLYGLPGFEGGEAEMVAGLKESPIYEQLIESGAEGVLRGAGAQGKLRSGAATAALAESGQDVLLDLYREKVGGLTGLARLPSLAPRIAEGISDIGGTLAQGRIAGANIRESARGQLMGMGTQLGVAALV